MPRPVELYEEMSRLSARMVDAAHAGNWQVLLDLERSVSDLREQLLAMPVEATIALIHAAGGVAVLAHPGLYRDDAMIPRLAAAGLDGIECWHTRHSVTSSESYARVAERLGLAATGGSDCHGMAKGEPLIGRIRLPYHRVTELKSRRPVTAAAA